MFRFFFFFFLFILCTSLFSQGWRSFSQVLIHDAQALPWAWTGGANAPQFSRADLNGDGTEDLILFDRASASWIIFEGEARPDSFLYQHRPEWAAPFPKLERWALLKDYNCDGLPDIFAWKRDSLTGQTGIAVWEAHRVPGSALLQFRARNAGAFLRFRPERQSTQSFNIYVSTIDLPAIEDIDGDGDLDILTFNIGGGYVEYFLNESVENGQGCDSLSFRLHDNCWGRFYESGITEAITLSSRIDSCAQFPNWSMPRSLSNPRHAGSTLLALDIDADGDKDLMLGDLSFANITLLTNMGTQQEAFIQQQDTFFPSYDVPAFLPTFPAAFYVDIDNDARRDLIVAPNADGIASNTETWFYKNRGSDDAPVFELQEREFLRSRSIDWGSHSAPCFLDINGDGRMDILLGNDGIYQGTGQFDAGLVLYLQNPDGSWFLADSNFAELRGLGLRRLRPSAADIDGDGDFDLLLGMQDGTLLFLENRGTAQNPSFLSLEPDYFSIDVGQHAHPQFFDVDGDGLLDLLVGERNGNTNLFRNQGTASQANFLPNPDSEIFSGIDAKPPGRLEGNSAPFLFQYQGQNYMLLGEEIGQMRLYSAPADWSGTFLEQPLDSAFLAYVGRQSSISLASIDGKMIAALGNVRGGLQLLELDLSPLVSLAEVQEAAQELFAYPNPYRGGQICLSAKQSSQEQKIKLYNIQGVLLDSWTTLCHQRQEELPSGIYILELQREGQSSYTKLLVP